ncbi:MAG TPA: hypothetical protein VGR51_09770 [Thermoplasmata archaeon]|nr:hypothetical protein [Thermoplasmata archaeon]
MKGLGDPREPAPFAVVVLVGFVVARFLSVALHEVAGHGVFAILTGGSFYGVYISPGSGFAFVFVPPAASPAAHALVALAGILVELIAGALLLRQYSRVRSFLGRLFVLLLLEVNLVYALVYLALGALDPAAGDSAQAVAALGAPHLVLAFLVVGVVWATALAAMISKEVIRLTAPVAPIRRQLLFTSLFWFTPILVGVLPSLWFATSSLLVYFVLFLLVGGGVFAFAAFAASRMGPAGTAEERPEGPFAPVAAAFVAVLIVWPLVFGLSAGTAHGLLLAEPPLAAERTWADVQALNVRVNLTTGYDVPLEFRFKGVPTLESPLERAAFATYEDRADFAYWTDVARALAVGMLNATAWNVTSATIDSPGTAWFDGRLVGNPRVVTLAVPTPAQRSRLTTVTTNGSGTFVTLYLLEPFRYGRIPCDACFVDEVNLTWPSGYGGPDPFRLVDVAAVGGSPDAVQGFDTETGLYFARFQNVNAGQTPRFYRLVLEVL